MNVPTAWAAWKQTTQAVALLYHTKGEIKMKKINMKKNRKKKINPAQAV